MAAMTQVTHVLVMGFKAKGVAWWKDVDQDRPSVGRTQQLGRGLSIALWGEPGDWQAERAVIAGSWSLALLSPLQA